MKVSVEWLKDYVGFRGAAEDIAERVTRAGREVNQIESSDTYPIGEV